MLHEAGYSGQIGSSWGGNSPVSPEVTVVQQKVRKEEKKGEATQLGTEEAAESTRQGEGQQREEEAAPAGC